QLYPVIQNARVCVLPSLVDNLPNTCLEAMALGRVVIGTRGASFDQLLDDGISGYLVAVGDAEGLARAIRRAWHLPPDEQQRMGEAAKKRVEQLDPAYAIPALIDYYGQVINRWQNRWWRRPFRRFFAESENSSRAASG